MFRKIITTCGSRLSLQLKQFSSVANTPIKDKVAVSDTFEVIDTRKLPSDDFVDHKSPESSVLEKCEEDISHVAPYLKPSFNFAAYVNKSDTLQHFLKLGVKLYKLEKDPEIPPYLLQLDFNKDIKNHIIFLTDHGLETEHLGNLIEKNPFIFKEDLDHLQVRVNYLKFKKFTNEMITRILQNNPIWLSFSTQEIDTKLGFFQKNFKLTGDEVRSLATKRPKLITYSVDKIKVNTFVLKEEMGFGVAELKTILLEAPKIFMKNQHSILKTFEYIHKEMNIPLETIVKMPQVLTFREFRVKQRYQFLEKLGKIQFDPKKPNYISLMTLVAETDSHFATEVAGSSIHAFNAFLKSI